MPKTPLETQSSLCSPEIPSPDDGIPSELEPVIAKLQSFAVLSAGWDGEGAASPSLRSIRQAIGFVRRITDLAWPPEPMLLSSGAAGLFWNDDRRYADLEFLIDGRMAYFIEVRDGSRHKGVVDLDSGVMPEPVNALISVSLKDGTT